jgi:hypothetical protein
VLLCAQTGELDSNAPPKPSVANQATSGKRLPKGNAPFRNENFGD